MSHHPSDQAAPADALSSATPATALAADMQQAMAWHRQQQWPEAALAYRAILEREPQHFDAWRLLGILHFQQGCAELAVEHLQRALQLDASQPQPYLMLGNAQQALGQSAAALASFEHALQLDPAYVEAHYNRALTLQVLQRLDQALLTYERVLQLDPSHADAYCNRGTVLQSLQHVDAALASYHQALQHNPDHVQALFNYGHILHYLQRPAEALPYYDRALQLKPDYVEALCNYGIALQALNQLDGAVACYTRATQLQPTLARAHWNQGLCHLLQGNFVAGWRKYEWGWICGQRGPRRSFVPPLWLGEADLRGKRIVLHAEQGYGDTLQFCRYAPLVAALGAQVWLEVPAPLASLLAQLPGIAGVVSQGTALPEADYHCPLMSLPLALRTQLATIPAQASYLQADPVKAAAWNLRLADQAGPRIGLAWSGNPAHPHDATRTITLAQLAPLLGRKARFIRVQTDLREADLARLPPSGILDFSAELHDFTDTAALLVNLDHIITVDTSIAHLAGALGIPTTLLLPFAPDFRWLLQRDDSPWYPSLRLLRQSSPGDWDGVIARAAAAWPPA